MSCDTKLNIDGVEYVRADSVVSDSPIRIVVVDGRWNLVGRYSLDGSEVVIDDAKIIRYWGTTKGLGEIAKAGPTSKTILDPTHGQVRIPVHAVRLTIDCVESKW